MQAYTLLPLLFLVLFPGPLAYIINQNMRATFCQTSTMGQGDGMGGRCPAVVVVARGMPWNFLLLCQFVNPLPGETMTGDEVDEGGGRTHTWVSSAHMKLFFNYPFRL